MRGGEAQGHMPGEAETVATVETERLRLRLRGRARPRAHLPGEAETMATAEAEWRRRQLACPLNMESKAEAVTLCQFYHFVEMYGYITPQTIAPVGRLVTTKMGRKS